MKNKKGFTLIELLAIIVILAIIAVITVPIILNIIDNSKKGAVMNSALGYRDAVQKYYVSKLIDNQNDESVSGYKTVSGLATDGLVVNGEVPSDGWVKLNKGQVVDYSLKFGDYVVSYDKTTNSVASVKNGEVGPMPAAKLYSESNNVLTKKDKSQMQAGDIVVLETETLQEKFIVLNDLTYVDSKAPTGTTALLSQNNINTETGLQELINNNSHSVAFSGSQYWTSMAADIYDSSKDKSPEDSDYSVAYYVNMYIKNLKSIGFNIYGGRILMKSEVDLNGIAVLYKQNSESYWLGSASSGESVRRIDPSGGFDSFGYYFAGAGVRPIIYINTDDIE